MKKLYLVDVSSMFFRAFYAIPPLTNGEGLPTNALYGFLNMTIKLIRDIHPDYLVYCFDRKEPSFRLELYEEYKANRTEMPEDLSPQIPYIFKLTDALGIPRMDKEGYEADDLIGSLARWGRENNLEVVIVSGDKDFAQLVKPFVSMYDTMKDVHYDSEGVKAKWGVTPEQFIDYLALVGDSSDNIPGVRGIGPKGAQKLLGDFGTLEGVYENVEKISGKSMKQKLIDNKDMAFLSRKLVSIVQDLDLVKDAKQLQMREIHKEELRELLEFLGFKSFIKNLIDGQGLKGNGEGAKSASKSKSAKADEVQVEESPSLGDLPSFEESTVSLAELDKLVEPYSEIWALQSERGFALAAAKKLLRVDADPHDIGRVLGKKHLQWKGFDLKSAWHLLNLDQAQLAWDSQLAAYVLNAGNTESLPDVYFAHMGEKWPELVSFSDLFRLHQGLERKLTQKLKSDHGEKIYREIELPLAPVLYEMERHGVLIDKAELDDQALSLTTDLQELEKAIHKEAGGSFNVASPKQLGEVLFERMGLTKGKKTKTGYSTNSDVLEKLVNEHPIAKMILEFRELSKLKSTYVDALPHLVSPVDGRVHTSFRQAATSTGRLSSVNPNLQNIPIRTERGRRVRRAFIAPKGHVLVSSDYSQIELRVLAHISDDPGLQKAFAEDRDIHSATAAEIFGVKLKDVDSDLRRTAKAVNFGIAYGQGVFGLSEALGIPRGEAADIIDKYFRKFSKVKEYMDAVVEQAKVKGYVETLLGRRRYITELKAKNQNLRKFGERAAINAPIQGTASDIVKLAMIKMRDEVSIPMILQVHDELLFECPKEDLDENSPLICEIMENAVKLKVPLKVNVASGKNWEDAHS